MKKPTYLWLLAISLSTLSCTSDFIGNELDENAITITENGSEVNSEDEDSHCFTTTLMAGQHHESGIVTLDIEDGDLIITYTMNDEWTIGTTHLSIGNCEDDWVPLNGGGNPKIGQFEFTEPFSESSTEVVYVISLDDLGDTICFAAHAEVEGPTGGETAWAEGTQFAGNGWAMFVQTDISECGEGTNPGPGGAF